MTRVLVVEDQRAFAAQLRQQLSALGWTVTVASTAEECFRSASTNPPQLILMAAELAPVNGLNLCNGLKGDPALRKIPLVIMTNKPLAAMEGHKKLASRADHYLEKGEEAHELVERLKQLFRKPSRPAMPAVKPEPAPKEATSSGRGAAHQTTLPSAGPDLSLDMPPSAAPRAPGARPAKGSDPGAAPREPPGAASREPPGAASREPPGAASRAGPAKPPTPPPAVESTRERILIAKNEQLEAQVAKLERELSSLRPELVALLQQLAEKESAHTTVKVPGAEADEVARLRKQFEEELLDQQSVWAAAVANARKAQAAAVKQTEEAQEKLRQLAAATVSDLAADTQLSPPPGADHAELERAHAAELAERDREHLAATRSLEERIDELRAELDIARNAAEEALRGAEDARAERQELAERVDALEEERGRLLDRPSQTRVAPAEPSRELEALREELAALEQGRKEDREAFERELADRDDAHARELVEIDQAHSTEVGELRRALREGRDKRLAP